MSRAPFQLPSAAPRAVALITFILTAAVAGTIVWGNEHRRIQTERTQLTLRVAERARFLERSVDRALSATHTVAAVIQENHGQVGDFAALAARILPLHPGVSAVGLAPNGIVSQVYPLAGNEITLGHNLFQDPARSLEARRARDTNQLTLAGPMELLQGGLGVIGRLPVTVDKPDGKPAFWGLVYVVIRTPDLLERTLGSAFLEQGLQFRLSRINPITGAEQEIGASPGSLIDPVVARVEVPNGLWLLAVAPTGGWTETRNLALPASLAVVFSLLVALVAQLTLELKRRQLDLEALVSRRTAELRASRNDLEQAQALAHTGSWVAGGDAPYPMSWSNEAYRIFGLPPGAPVSFDTFVETAEPADRGKLRNAWDEARESGRLDVEFRLAVAGKARWVRCRAELDFTRQGALRRGVGTVQDLTEAREASERLGESESRYRALVENAPIAIFVNREDRVVLANEACLQLFGATHAQQLLGRPVLELFDPTSRPVAEQRIRRLRETGLPVPLVEERILRLDGRAVDVEVNAAPFTDHGGKAIHVVLRDISRRKEDEAALRQSQDMFAQLFQGSPAMMALSTLDEGRLIEVNERFLQTSGFSREEILGHTSIEIGWVTPDQREPLARLLRTEGRIKDAEATMRRKNGEPLHVLYSGELLDIHGRRLLLSSWIDITERRRVEGLLRLQSSALEAAVNGIVITDREGRITWANAAFTRFSGYSREESLGLSLADLAAPHANANTSFAQAWKTLHQGQAWSGEVINRRRDGSVYTVEMTLTPVKDQAGEITHYIGVKQDISQRKILEEKFRQAQKMEAVGQLAGGVAHDFNNIMAGVLMYLSLLQDDPSLDASTRSALRDLTREVQRGAGLTRQLLAFSRQQAMVPEPLNVNDVVAGLLKMLRRLLGEHITITLQPAPALPLVEADVGMIEQVVINLAVNARDAMPRGGQLTVSTVVADLAAAGPAAHPDARPGRFVRLDVTDTGSGMDPATLQRIFEPFFTTKPVGKGTGLGLATVYGIVKQHQGWIEVQSTVGQGTTFQVFLPVAARDAGAPSPESTPPMPRSGSETVLLVEDEPSVRAVAAISLRRAGYTVLEAGSGPEALRLWDESRGAPELLVTDMVMPGGMTGRDVAARLRERKPSLAVILCTGYSHAMAEHPLEARDRMRLLTKPFDATTLAAAARRCLDDMRGA